MGRKEEEWVENLVREYTGLVYSIAFRILRNSEEASDVVQETFIKLYKNIDKYKEEKNLKNWIYTIALNSARDAYRKQKRKGEEAVDTELVSDSTQHNDVIEDRLLLEKVILNLTEDQKQVVQLYYFESMNIAEISEILEINESLVKVRLHRARKAMLGYAEELDV